MSFLEKYPALIKRIDALCQTRRHEILSHMTETDIAYESLFDARATASMELKSAVVDTAADRLFEQYADAVYAQEVYELYAIYRQGIFDILDVLHDYGFADCSIQLSEDVPND